MNKNLPNILILIPIHSPQKGHQGFVAINKESEINDSEIELLKHLVQSKKNSIRSTYFCLGKISDHKKNKDGTFNELEHINQINTICNIPLTFYKDFDAEFVANLKLFNFGSTAKDNIDLLDNFTTDAFSKVEGSTGYSIEFKNLEQDQQINTLAMIAPVSNEEKQTLLEPNSINKKIKTLLEIIEFLKSSI